MTISYTGYVDDGKEESVGCDNKISLIMKSLREFYSDSKYITRLKNVIEQKDVISLRILDWFVTNYSKKYRIFITQPDGNKFDVYINYRLKLKSLSKKCLDPFNRKNKTLFYYTDTEYIETSCGQLSFFKWCFENNILEYIENNIDVIEADMKNSIKHKRSNKRKYLSPNASKSLIKRPQKYIVSFD